MMPKSTATSRPSSSTNRLPGCMSAWKKPSRNAWRRKRLDHVAAERRQIEALGLERGMVVERACRRSIPASALRARCGPSRPSARESRNPCACSRAISDSAAASSRKSISIATERASVATASTGRRRCASSEHASAMRAAKKNASRSDFKAPLDAGAKNFTATGLRAPSDVDLGAVHLCDRGGGDRRPEARIDRARAACRRRPAMAASASACGNGAMLVLQAFQIVRDLRADHIRARGQELAELDVSGPELGRVRRQAGLAPSLVLGRSISRASAIAVLAGSGSGRVSTSANTPSRANTKPARARRMR